MAANDENMGGKESRVQFHKIARAGPNETPSREQLMALKTLARTQLPVREIKFHPPALGMMGVKVHHCQDHVAAVVGSLALGDDPVVSGLG